MKKTALKAEFPAQMTGRERYAWIILTVGTFVVFGSLGLARFGYSLILPSMQSALSMDNTGAGALATTNLIGYLLFSLIGGALASRYGTRMIISLGMALVGIGMLFTGVSNSVWSAMLWRTVTGFGSGASNVPVMALMSAWFGTRLRGLATGIAVSGSSIALIVIGPLVPRILLTYGDNGWRIAWFVFSAATLLLFILSALLLKNEPAEHKRRAPAQLDRENLGEPAATRNLQWGRNKHVGPAAARTLQWGRVYRSRTVWHLGLLYAAFGFSYIIYMTFFIRYLVGEVHFTHFAAGNLFMLMGWFSLGCGLIWGSLSDRIGRKTALIFVYLLQALAYSLFALFPTRTGLSASAILFGLTAWSAPAIMAATCGDVVGHRLAPAALGFVTLFFGIGQAVGPSVAGAIADKTGSFQGAFLLASAVTIVGVLGALFFKTSKTQA
jgi:MFS family permease